MERMELFLHVMSSGKTYQRYLDIMNIKISYIHTTQTNLF